MNKFLGTDNLVMACANCGKIVERHSNSQKYCPSCKNIVERRKALERYYKRSNEKAFKLARKKYYAEWQCGLRRGYNQSGENNNNWQGGAQSGYYDKFMKDARERCGAKSLLLVHHRDRNRHNNSLENLETLCKRCHQIKHKCWENFAKGIVRSDDKKESSE